MEAIRKDELALHGSREGALKEDDTAGVWRMGTARPESQDSE